MTGAHPPAGQEWSRLSRRMLVVHPVIELFKAIPVLVAVLFAGSRNGAGAVGGLSVALLTVVVGLARWFTTRYRISPSQVQLRHGLLRRREVAVPRDRVRTVDVEATPVHRIVGLTRVVIGTGRSDRGDQDHSLRLDGLTAAQAGRLRDELLHHRQEHPAEPGPVDTSTPVDLLVLDPAWIRYGPFSLTGLVTVAAVAALAWRGINEAHVDVVRNPAAAALERHVDSTPAWVLGAQATAVLLVLVALLSTLGYVLAFWGMRVTRTGAGTLHLTRGLLTTRAITLEERRIRGVEVSEPLLLRLVGGARLIAVATGLRVGRGSERGGSVLAPPAPRAVVRGLAAAVLDGPGALDAPLRTHPPAATRRRAVRALGPGVVLAAGAVALGVAAGAVAGWGSVAAAVLVVAALLARDRAAALGHAVTPSHVVVREGSLVRRRVVLQREATVGVTLRATVFQRRAGLATVVATTAAGRQAYRALDAGAAQADRLALDLLGPAAAPFVVPD